MFLVGVQPFKAPFLLRFELHVSPLTLSEIHNKPNDLNVLWYFRPIRNLFTQFSAVLTIE